ncbi:MAG: BMC domain-containing protein, partial [Lachnospiraceae bacterium]|nr:BMC domain-containing protein [Lachnospiraceae bacterium]
MGKAYGFIEITGVVAAMDALDIMCKAANVELATWERKLGGRLVTLVIEGDVSAVRQAVE